MPALPHSAQALIAILGLEQALAFMREYGGQVLYLPVAFDGATPWGDHFTEAQYQQLQRWITKHTAVSASEGWAVPKADKYTKTLRNQQICQARMQGATLNQLAARFHLTSRQVENILAAEVDSRQGELFGNG